MFVHLGQHTVSTPSSLPLNTTLPDIWGALQARTRDGFMVGERNGGLNIVENRDGDGFVDLPPLAML